MTPANKGHQTSPSYRVACPLCGADVGEKCKLIVRHVAKRMRRPGPGQYGYAYNAHPQRLKLARETL